MRRTASYVIAVSALAGLPLFAAAPAHASGNGTELSAKLTQLNDSGMSGTAWGTITQKGNGYQLHIKLTTAGALAGAPHAQHIHIGGTNSCPNPNQKGTGFKGAIRTLDAAPSYGAVKVSLTKSPGKTDASAALDVPNFPVGNAQYERTFMIPQGIAKDVMAGKGVVVVHGVDHDGSGKYDGDIMSDLDKKLPSEATDPAACGAFNVAQMRMPEGGVATGGVSTEGVEHADGIAAGSLALGAGVAGLFVIRRRGALKSKSN